MPNLHVWMKARYAPCPLWEENCNTSHDMLPMVQMISTTGHAINRTKEPGQKTEPGMDNQGLGMEHTYNK